MPANTTNFQEGGFDLAEKYVANNDLFLLRQEFFQTSTYIDQFVYGQLWYWGSNGAGQLGTGAPTTSVVTPTQLGLLNNWRDVSCGANHTNFITNDGRLMGTGQTSVGNLGNSSAGANLSSPIFVGNDTNWVRFSENGNASSVIARKTDNTLWAWGHNGFGQLGQGDTTHRSSPVQIGAGTNWRFVNSGYETNLFIGPDNSLYGCGFGFLGQLAQGVTGGSASVYSQLTTLKKTGSVANTDWSTASTNYQVTMAISNLGLLWGCGSSSTGAVGLNTVLNYSWLTQIGALNNWKYSANGQDTTICIKTDGTLWSWGNNTYGQLGSGTVVHRSSPVQVGALTNWRKVSSHSTAQTSFHLLKMDGTMWSVGYNLIAGLGQGNYNNLSTITQVGTLNTWKRVKRGANHGFAFR